MIFLFHLFPILMCLLQFSILNLKWALMIFLFHFFSILIYTIIMEGHWGTTDDFATIPCHLVLFSPALIELAKSIPVHYLILSWFIFFCLHRLFFPLTASCRVDFAKLEILET